MASTHYARLDDEDDEGLQLHQQTTAYDPITADHSRQQQQQPIVQSSTATDRPTIHITNSQPDQHETTHITRPISPASSTSSIEANNHRLSVVNDDDFRRFRTGVVSPDLRRPSMEERLRYSFSPATHHLKYPSDKLSLLSAETVDDELDTARVYSYWRQTRRLWRLATGEWLITAVLCGIYGAVLAVNWKKTSISSKQVNILNASFAMITFLLGVNLTASMRSYAKMLRWILLSMTYQPLETFDLILHCESLLNVVKLFWKAGKHHSRRLRWTTQAMCLFWLFSNMAVTLFVAMIGLTYNTEPSRLWSDSIIGTTMIKDFRRLETDSTYDDQKLVQSYGMQGFNMGMNNTLANFTWPDIKSDPITYRDGNTRYFFASWNPEDPSLSLVRDVNLITNTECYGYDVLVGGGGTSSVIKFTNSTGSLVSLDITPTNATLPGPGGFTAISYQCPTCKLRSTHTDIFVAGNEANSTGRVFACTTYVGYLWWFNPKTSDYEMAPDSYQFSNATARALAGAIGWSGDYVSSSDFDFDFGFDDGDLEEPSTSGVSYSRRTPIAATLRTTYNRSMPLAVNVSDFVSSFTIKAIASIDNGGSEGLPYYKEVFGRIPLRAQELKVEWKWCILLLTGIPSLQLFACILVFSIANKAIIRDDSALSMAKLYHNLLSAHGLADRASMLKGDELVDIIKAKTGNKAGPMVIYGWKEKDKRDDQGRAIGRLDVYEMEREEMGRKEVVTPDTSSTYTMQAKKPRVRNLFYGGLKYD